MRKSLILVFVLILLSTSTLYFFSSIKGDGNKITSTNGKTAKTNQTSLTSEVLKNKCLKDSNCYLEEVAKVMNEVGVSAGLDLFIKTSSITNGFYADCHNIAHLLGQRAFAIDGDATLDSHANTCSWGYGHGVMLAAALKYSIPEFADRFKKYCEEDPEPVGCIHGIGHSLQESKATLADASVVCEKAGGAIDAKTKYTHITDKTTVGACIEGWVMQALGSYPYKEMKNPSQALEICKGVEGVHADICRYMSVRNWVDMGMTVEERYDRLKQFRALCQSLPIVNVECGRYLGEATDDLAVVGTDFEIRKVASDIANYCDGKMVDICTQSFTIFQINRNNGLVNNMKQVCTLLNGDFKLSCEKAVKTRE